MEMTMAEYEQEREAYMGYCTACDEITRDCTEPDAEEYNCPACEQNTVMGIENAVITEKIEIVDDE